MSVTTPSASATLPSSTATRGAELSHAGFFLLRTPLLPIDDFFSWSEEGRFSIQPRAAATEDDAWLTAKARLRRSLQQRLSLLAVREALSLASPNLFMNLHAWEQNPDSERGRKVEYTLVRYFSRMTSRSTPFGLFAGCALGSIGSQTELTLAPRHRYRCQARLDHRRTVESVSRLLQEQHLREQVEYALNSTLFLGAGRWRYAEARAAELDRVSYHLVAIDPSPHLNAVLQHLQERECSLRFESLVELVLRSTSGVSNDDAAAFIHALIDSQILISALDPQLVGAEPLADVVRQAATLDLPSGALAHEQFQRLQAIAVALADYDSQGFGRDFSANSILVALTGGPGTEQPAEAAAHRIHVDLWKPLLAGVLHEDVAREAARGVTLLARLSRNPPHLGLRRFKDAFRHRYETQRVPLLLALDPECGIGFEDASGLGGEAAALVGQLGIKPPEDEQPKHWSGIDRAIFELLAPALMRRDTQIEITEDWLRALPAGPAAPQAVAVLGALLREQHAATDASHNLMAPLSQPMNAWRLRIEVAFGPSGLGLLGRFACSDRKLLDKLAELAAAEQALHPDAILAEVAHIPPGRAGNVAAHPLLRDYEIPLLARSAAPTGRQIPLRDLLLSLDHDRLIIYSQRLGRRILPRLSSAHHHAHPSNVSIYRFLCALQEQESLTSLAWSWGPLASAEYLPRVVSGRLILTPARWQLGGSRLHSLIHTDPDKGPHERFRRMAALRSELALPRFVNLVEGDQTLLVDLDNVLSVEAFFDYAKGHKSITIEESFLTPDRAIVTGPEGRFACEVVIPLVTSNAQSKTVSETKQQSAPISHRETPSRAVRSFPPGSEWLYCKLYAGPASVDRILIGALRPLIHELLAAEVIDRWFFVRYADPTWHLRLRFHGEPRPLQTLVLPRLQSLILPLIEDELVVRMQVDSYEPEWNRYGGSDGLAASEDIFSADSLAALDLLEYVVGDSRAELRWKCALASMAGLLSCLFVDPQDRLSVVEEARRDFAAEFALDGAATQKLGARFRQERAGLESLLRALDEQRPEPGFLGPLIERAHRLTPAVAALGAASQQGTLRSSMVSLALSYLHMTANRILRSASRIQEVVIYDFLARLYRSQLARTALTTAPPDSLVHL